MERKVSMRIIPFNTDWIRHTKEYKPWEKPVSGDRVDLPDDFIIDQPRSPSAPGGPRTGFFPDGSAVYEKLFEAPADWQGKTVFLYLDGAYMNTRITFNEETVAQHPYGYTPITVDLTPNLRFDIPNRLSISVQGNQPSSRWYSGAGIYREVSLWVGEPCCLDPHGLFITTPAVERDRAEVEVKAEAINAASCDREAVLEVQLLYGGEIRARASEKLLLRRGERVPYSMRLSLPSPALWDDVSPNLYDAVVTLSAEGQKPDSIVRKIGVRKIEISAADGLRINGRKLKLRGGCIHHDNGILGARALPRAEERKLENLKDAGFNAIRTAHNPPSEALLDACDRLGIFVLDEFFDCWRMGKTDGDYHLWFDDWWQRDIDAVIRRDRNHPCIYCWSFGNEIREANGSGDGSCSRDGVRLVKAQAEFIRSLDPTRPVTCGGMFLPRSLACGPIGYPSIRTSVYNTDADQAAWFGEMVDQLDIVSLNYSFQHYGRFHELFPDKPLQGSETLGIETWGNREAVRSRDYVIGDFVWTAHDNLGEAGAGRSYWDPEEGKGGLMAGYPWLSCFQGDLALDGERLPRSHYRKVLWGLDRGIHLFSAHPADTGRVLYGTGFHWHRVWPRWTYPEEYIGKPVQVEAYADCDEVEFFINGNFCGRAVPEKMIASVTIPYQPGELRAVAFRDGRPAAEDTLTTTGSVHAIMLEPDRRELRADGMDLCYVGITLADKDGRRVYGEDRELSAFLNGPGTLAGFGSNNPCTQENFGTGRRVTWNGRAMLVLRAGHEPGVLDLTVSAPGMSTQLLRIRTV